MKIYIKGTFIPLGDVNITVVNPARESITYQENAIQLSSESGEIVAVKPQEITTEEYAYVQDSDNTLPRNEQFESYLSGQYQAVRTILGYIQAFDGVFNLDTERRMRSTYEWSEDRSSWLPVPDKRITTWKGTNLRQTLADNFMGNIERLANGRFPVFLAFNHLYKAYEDANPRFKWINGTIAAEHAFKEFLSLLDPRTESLMLNVPSPPIDKLYKNVLESYTGQSSSMYKELKNGAEIRNKLIHRPAMPAPDLKATNVYLHQVEVAIFELYTRLDGKDAFLAHALVAAQYRLQHVKEGGSHFQ